MSLIVNKKAKHEYFFKELFEAGIVLSGAEVKSVKAGSSSLSDSFVKIIKGEPILFGSYISPYKYAFDPSFEPKRERKLLLTQKEIDFLIGKLASENLTIVPTKMYTKNNLVKLEVALASPKKKFDKREILRRKAIDKEAQSSLRADKKASQGSK